MKYSDNLSIKVGYLIENRYCSAETGADFKTSVFDKIDDSIIWLFVINHAILSQREDSLPPGQK